MAAGLCAGQCILKVNGSNVMNDGALEVLEHLQAFRSRREEALVSPQGVGRLPQWGQQGEGSPSLGGTRGTLVMGDCVRWASAWCFPKLEELDYEPSWPQFSLL